MEIYSRQPPSDLADFKPSQCSKHPRQTESRQPIA